MTNTPEEFPIDKNGMPLAWPCPNYTMWYVDAWNGIYSTKEEALAESKIWTAAEDERILRHSEDIVDEQEKLARLRARKK